MISTSYIMHTLQIPKENKEYVTKFRNAINKNFGNRIVFLGLHGSSRHNALAPDYISDIDLELILDIVKPTDLSKIKNIVLGVPVKVECQVRSYFEIQNNKSLIHKTKYKIFMYNAYANGITLLGKNIYKELIKKFNNKQYKDSLLFNIQLEWKDIRKKYLGNKKAVELNKTIEVFLFDILLYFNVINYRDLDKKKIFEAKRYNVYELSSNYFSSILTQKEREFLFEYQKIHASKKFDIFIIEPLEKLLRKTESSIK